jgi:hypothetical protein
VGQKHFGVGQRAIARFLGTIVGKACAGGGGISCSYCITGLEENAQSWHVAAAAIDGQRQRCNLHPMYKRHAAPRVDCCERPRCALTLSILRESARKKRVG